MADSAFEYYQQLALQYDKARFGSSYGRYVHRQEFQFLTAHLPPAVPARTLDLACGTGRLLAFADTGADFSPNMLAVAQKKWPDKRLVCADATNLPFPDASFDAVFSLHFIMHLSQEQTRQVLQEVQRILTPGGLFICDFPSAKRRQITGGYNRTGWHGANAYSLAAWQALTYPQWRLTAWRGVLFFPIHRLPMRLRWPLRRTDDWFCQHVLAEYASYLLVCLKKQ